MLFCRPVRRYVHRPDLVKEMNRRIQVIIIVALVGTPVICLSIVYVHHFGAGPFLAIAAVVLGLTIVVWKRKRLGILLLLLCDAFATILRARREVRRRSRPIVVAHAHEAAPNRDYRLIGDAPNVVRINQPWPEGIAAHVFKMIGDLRNGVPVAGISHGKRPANARAFIEGEEREILLQRDPANKYDKNAIRVIGRWRDRNGRVVEGELGWVPKEHALFIAQSYPPEVPLGGIVMMMFRPTFRKKNAGLRIGIGRPGLRELRKAGLAD